MSIEDSFIERVNKIKKEFSKSEGRFIFGLFFIEDKNRPSMGIYKVLCKDSLFYSSKITDLQGKETDEQLRDTFTKIDKVVIRDA